jgi:hypothetical protein
MATLRHSNFQQYREDPDEFEYFHQLTEEEGIAFFDEQARLEMGMSGEEFLRRWDAGEFRPIPDTREGWKIGRLVMLMPFARRTSS